MNNDFITAAIIVGSFFVVIICIFAEGFIREWIAENNMRKSYAGKIDDLMRKGWDI